MNSVIINKLKKKVLKKLSIAVLLFLSLGMFFTSCDKDNGLNEGETEQTDKKNVGIHKIVLTTSGDSEVFYVANFIGYDEKGMARRLYDANNENRHVSYMENASVGENCLCYTEDKTYGLDLVLNFGYVGDKFATASYTIDFFINDKKIDSVTKNISFTGAVGDNAEYLNFSTISR